MDISKVKEHFKKHEEAYLGIAFGSLATIVGLCCVKEVKHLRLGPTFNTNIYHNDTEKLCRMVIERSANWGKPIRVADIIYDADTFKNLAEAMLQAVENAGKGAIV